MIIKVCGMRDPGNIREVAAIQGIDMIGMIFYPKSLRYVDSPGTAATVLNLKKTGIVGVFVNESPEAIAWKSASYHLDYIQLHGNESPDYLKNLRNIIPSSIQLIKAITVRSNEDLQHLQDYEGLCEYLLFDTPTGSYGGSGHTFDWNLLQDYAGPIPFLLSGGIGPNSIETLLNFKHPFWAGLDLNSRFETEPGVKDVALISDFVRQIKTQFP